MIASNLLRTDLQKPSSAKRQSANTAWSAYAMGIARSMAKGLVVIAFSVLVIGALRVALSREEAMLNAQKQARAGMYFYHE